MEGKKKKHQRKGMLLGRRFSSSTSTALLACSPGGKARWRPKTEAPGSLLLLCVDSWLLRALLGTYARGRRRDRGRGVPDASGKKRRAASISQSTSKASKNSIAKKKKQPRTFLLLLLLLSRQQRPQRVACARLRGTASLSRAREKRGRAPQRGRAKEAKRKF